MSTLGVQTIEQSYSVADKEKESSEADFWGTS